MTDPHAEAERQALHERVAAIEARLAEQDREIDALRQSEERYRLIADNVTDLMITLDMELRFTYVNPAVERLRGYPPSEALMQSLEAYLTPASYQVVFTAFNEDVANDRKRCYALDRSRTLELELTHEDGSTVWTEGRFTFLRDTVGSPVGILGAIRDITGRKRAEAEKNVIQAQLLQSQKIDAIGKLAGGVAHDFNNLLTVIRGQLDLAMMVLEETDPVRRDLEYARSASTRAADLTRQLLLFSRKQPMAFRPVDLNQTVDNLLKMLMRLIGEDITVYVDLGAGLHTVKADIGTLEQVLMNLAVNARDAMPSGGDLFIETRNVDVQKVPEGEALERRPGPYVRLSVRDTGSGIPPAAMEHIFEPFFTTKNVDASGTGLGLSVAYGIVKQHAGWIEVASELGQGSVFNVFLPAYSGVPARKEEEVSWSQFRGEGEGVLLIEDEAGVRRLTKRILTNNGYLVFTAANADEAEAVFARHGHEIAIVFSDVVLPGQSGIDLVDRLRERRPGLRVMLCSGYTDEKSQWPLIRDRGFHFVRKPFNISELLRTLREALAES